MIKYEIDRERMDKVLIVEFLVALYSEGQITPEMFKQLMGKVDIFVYEGVV